MEKAVTWLGLFGVALFGAGPVAAGLGASDTIAPNLLGCGFLIFVACSLVMILS